MDQSKAMLDKNSKRFFIIFFLAILCSIGLTYYTIEVQKHYRAFTEEDVIPEPVDVYVNAFHGAQQWFMNLKP